MIVLQKNSSTELLQHLLEEFRQLGLYPILGAEIEFYLFPDKSPIEKLELDLSIEQEKGLNQFEIKINHSADIFYQIQQLLYLKEIITNQALRQGMIASFNAKPVLDQPGSALHIHLHLENEQGENLYIKKNNQETDFMLHSIGGLCATMEENMLIFAPYEEAYLRYKGSSLESPSKICWGGNNRSAAIRIPLDEKFNRRLEHRVSCADSSPIEVICAILYGIYKGITEKITPPEKLYGNAFLEQYNYTLLPLDFDTAKKLSKPLRI